MITRQDILDEYAEDVDRFTADHVATYREDGTVLDFRQPGTSVYWCRFRIDRRFLFAYGDVGDAIYEWGTDLTWEFLAGCSFSYFESKLVAHTRGKFARDWDERVAETNLRYQVQSEDTPEEDWNAFIHPDTDTYRDPPDWTSRDEWLVWLREFGDEVFGSCWWEWAPGVGDVPDVRVAHQWRMLALAFEQAGDRP